MSPTEFVFRHAGGCLIETPDLELRRDGDVENWAWVATIWTDRRVDGGWGVLEWRPGERGWVIPFTSAIGDVIEFGVGAVDARGHTRFDRWWGWLDRLGPRAAVLMGPYPHPSDAETAARRAVDEIRLGELDPPDLVDALAANLRVDHPD
jgi:hypothetical protein